MEEESKIEHLKNKIMYSENFQMCFDLKEQFCAASNNPEQQRAILQDLLNEYAKFGEDVSFHFLLFNYMLLGYFKNISEFVS